MIFKLTPEQEIEGAEVGFRRNLHALRSGLTPRHPQKNYSLWAGHIHGAIAENAVSLKLGLPWTGRDYLVGVNGSDPPADVGERTDVKWTSNSLSPLLTIDPRKDTLDRKFMLVSGLPPELEIHGWIWGHEAEKRGTKVDYPERTVYRVAAAKLRPVPE